MERTEQTVRWVFYYQSDYKIVIKTLMKIRFKLSKKLKCYKIKRVKHFTIKLIRLNYMIIKVI